MGDEMIAVHEYDYATFPRQFVSYRWFKPLFVFVLAFVFMLAFAMALVLVANAWADDPGFLVGAVGGYEEMDVFSGPGALLELGSIVVMLPALALAGLVVGDRPWSSYSSSRGGWNWAAFLKCLGVACGVIALSAAVELLVLSDGSPKGAIRFSVVGFAICTLLTPLQCVAEEYVFRGFIIQTVGSWAKLPAIAIVVAALAFAAGHPYNQIGVAVIFLNGVVWGFVVWRTKGLEATSALHIANNLYAFYAAGFGLVEMTSQIDIPSLLLSCGVDVLFAVLVLVVGGRRGWFVATRDDVAKFNKAKELARARKALPPEMPR